MKWLLRRLELPCTIAAPWNLISKKILIPGLEKITKTLEQRAKLGESYQNFGLAKIFFLPLTCSLRSENQLDDLKMLIMYSI